MVYGYTALMPDGTQVKGQISCGNPNEVLSHLIALDATPIDVYKKEALLSTLTRTKPKVRDMSIFCRQLVSMLGAGVSILDAIEALTEQTENPMLSAALGDVLVAVKSGTALSEAFAEHPKIFTTLLVTMIEAGEASGNLDISFARMATQYEKNAKLRKCIKKATIYPMGVCVITVIAIAILLGYVVPQFESLLEEMDMALPLLTQIVLNLSKGFKSYWFIIFGGLFGGIYGAKVFWKTEQGKYVFDGLLLKFKMTRNIIMKSASAMMCRTMSTLLSSGVTIVDATGIASRVMSNIYYRDVLANVQKVMLGDSDFVTPLKESEMFPIMLCNMVAIGVESGSMEELLDTVADYYENDVEETVDATTQALEPIIIVILAAIIGTVVVAVMLPLMSSLDAISNM